MSERVQHVLVTRYNIGIFNKPIKNKKGSSQDARAWMDHRLDLFSRFTASSVKAQTTKDFTWILLLDSQTDQSDCDKILEAAGPQVVSAIVDSVEYCKNPRVVGDRVIRASLGPEATWLLSTRLDNDDALHESALQAIRDQAESNLHKCFIDMVSGYMLAADGSHLRYLARRQRGWWFTPFFSFLGKIGKGHRTVLGRKHPQRAHEAPTIRIGGTPKWMQIVHDWNAGNTFSGQIVDPVIIPEGFHIHVNGETSDE